MGFVKKQVKNVQNFVSDPIKATDKGLTEIDKKITQPVIQTADKTITAVGKTVEAVAKDPLPVIASVALTAAGVPAPLANAMVVAMQGGSPQDMAKAALAGSVPSIGSGISNTLGVNAAVGNALASTGVQVALGVPLDKAITNTAISAAAQSTAPYIAEQVGKIIETPTMIKAITDIAVTAEIGILKGQSEEQIGQAMTMVAIRAIPSVYKEMTKDASWQPKFDPESKSFVGPPLPVGGVVSPLGENDTIESSPLSTSVSITPVELPRAIESTPPPTFDSDAFDYSALAQFNQPNPYEPVSAEAPYTPPVIPDYVPVDYSLSAGSTTNPGVDPTTGTGFTTPDFATSIPESVTYPYDFTPDYSLYNPATDSNSGLGLQMPESPAIKSMGGGQGLTVPLTQPDGTTGTMGALGFTPENATPALGNPDSFINDPEVTGQPVMASDPAYDDPFSWFKFSGGLGGMNSNNGNSGSYGGYSQKSASGPLSNPVSAKAAESYLKGVTPETPLPDLQMAQLQQLYPTINPDLSKILLDRGMLLTPESSTVDFGSINQPTQNLNKSNAEMLSASEFADFGQPEFAKGGNVQLPKGHHPEFITGKTGHYAQGRGTGQSDDIPAVLYSGDYVMDADIVAALGDGSSKAGAGALEQFRQSIPVSNSGGGQQIPAKIADSEFVFPSGFVTALGKGSNKQGSKMLDAMREQIRAHKRSAPETKIPPKARSPLQYMREATKG